MVQFRGGSLGSGGGRGGGVAGVFGAPWPWAETQRGEPTFVGSGVEFGFVPQVHGELLKDFKQSGGEYVWDVQTGKRVSTF